MENMDNMDNNMDDPKIYNMLSYILVVLSFYIFYRVFTLNEDDYYYDSESDDENNHSN
jgi:hypothetical protein